MVATDLGIEHVKAAMKLELIKRFDYSFSGGILKWRTRRRRGG
jgi:hypothetical protein